MIVTESSNINAGYKKAGRKDNRESTYNQKTQGLWHHTYTENNFLKNATG